MPDNYYAQLKLLYKNESLFFKEYIVWRLKFFFRHFKKIEELTPPKGRILDLGCGFGQLANFLTLARPEREVIGIDENEKRIKIAQKTGRKNLVFKLGDVNDQLEKEDGFEAIIMTDFLHHLDYGKQDILLARISRFLKPGRRLIIMEIMEKPKWKYVISWLADLLLYPFKPKQYYRKIQEMKSKLESLDFSVEVIPADQSSIFASVIYNCEKKGREGA